MECQVVLLVIGLLTPEGKIRPGNRIFKPHSKQLKQASEKEIIETNLINAMHQ